MNLVFKSGKNEFSGKARNPGATHFGACTTAGTSYSTEIKRNSRVVAFPKIFNKEIKFQGAVFSSDGGSGKIRPGVEAYLVPRKCVFAW